MIEQELKAPHWCSGRCHCGAIHYEFKGLPHIQGRCNCHVCQFLSGGKGKFYMVVSRAGFRFTKGIPNTFTPEDPPFSAERYFCRICGTHLAAKLQGETESMLVETGTLDQRHLIEQNALVPWSSDVQYFH